ALPDPAGCEVLRVVSASEMADAVKARLRETDLAFFAAAVADFAPSPAKGKLRRDGRERLVLEMERTRDTLAESIAARTKALLVGFAAEIGPRYVEAAREKLA